MYRIFTVPYDKSWSDCVHPEVLQITSDGERFMQMPEEIRPDRPSSNNWVYSKTAVCELEPAPPLPYASWNDAQAYVH